MYSRTQYCGGQLSSYSRHATSCGISLLCWFPPLLTEILLEVHLVHQHHPPIPPPDLSPQTHHKYTYHTQSVILFATHTYNIIITVHLHFKLHTKYQLTQSQFPLLTSVPFTSLPVSFKSNSTFWEQYKSENSPTSLQKPFVSKQAWRQYNTVWIIYDAGLRSAYVTLKPQNR